MSLHDPDAIKQFGRNCHQVWTSWLLPAVPTEAGKTVRIATRRSLIRSHIATAAGGIMPPPRVRWELAPGAVGVFSADDWTLTLSAKYTENDGILFREYVRLCLAIYHELRHAEQFYRMAQGLASGDLHFPDTSQQQVTQAVASVKGATSVKDKATSFETMSLTKISNTSRTQIIQKWLGIPMNVVQHADATATHFPTFAAGTRPDWFKTQTVKAAVEDWMRSTYKASLGEMNVFVTYERSLSRHLNKMYANLVEEQDARRFAEAVAVAFQNEMKFPFEILKDQSRLNLGLFDL